MRRRGVCAPFADPTLPADQAHPVWLPETGAVRLHLTSQLAGDPAGDGPGLRLLDLPNVEHLLIDTDGRQHVVLRSGARLKQLVVIGQHVLVAPVTFSLRLSQPSDIATLAGELAGLQSFLSAGRKRAAGSSTWPGGRPWSEPPFPPITESDEEEDGRAPTFGRVGLSSRGRSAA